MAAKCHDIYSLVIWNILNDSKYLDICSFNAPMIYAVNCSEFRKFFVWCAKAHASRLGSHLCIWAAVARLCPFFYYILFKAFIAKKKRKKKPDEECQNAIKIN